MKDLLSIIPIKTPRKIIRNPLQDEGQKLASIARSNLHTFWYGGELVSLSERAIARKFNVSHRTLSRRFRCHKTWDVLQAVVSCRENINDKYRDNHLDKSYPDLHHGQSVRVTLPVNGHDCDMIGVIIYVGINGRHTIRLKNSRFAILPRDCFEVIGHD